MWSTSSENIWLRHLLREFGVFLKGPTPLYADNTSAIQIAKNTVFHDRTKHIEIDCHFIRRHVVSNTIYLPYISSLDQLTNIFTKGLPWDRHDSILSKLIRCCSLHQFEGECRDPIDPQAQAHNQRPMITYLTSGSCMIWSTFYI